MLRKAPTIKIPQADKVILLRWANSRTLSKQAVDRAKMIFG
jgi:hypothetical protein